MVIWVANVITIVLLITTIYLYGYKRLFRYLLFMIIPHIIISKRQILYDYISSHYQDLICPPNSTTVQKTCILMKPFEKLWFSKLKYLKVELKGKEIRFFFKKSHPKLLLAGQKVCACLSPNYSFTAASASR